MTMTMTVIVIVTVTVTVTKTSLDTHSCRMSQHACVFVYEYVYKHMTRACTSPEAPRFAFIGIDVKARALGAKGGTPVPVGGRRFRSQP